MKREQRRGRIRSNESFTDLKPSASRSSENQSSDVHFQKTSGFPSGGPRAWFSTWLSHAPSQSLWPMAHTLRGALPGSTQHPGLRAHEPTLSSPSTRRTAPSPPPGFLSAWARTRSQTDHTEKQAGTRVQVKVCPEEWELDMLFPKISSPVAPGPPPQSPTHTRPHLLLLFSPRGSIWANRWPLRKGHWAPCIQAEMASKLQSGHHEGTAQPLQGPGGSHSAEQPGHTWFLYGSGRKLQPFSRAARISSFVLFFSRLLSK